MKKITKIEQCQGVSVTDKKVRVAAYCRVSTDSEEQHESLETQKDHYSRFIKSNCEWEYAGLYYDEGISGTKKERREGLLTLISDCEKGLIDVFTPYRIQSNERGLQRVAPSNESYEQ